MNNLASQIWFKISQKCLNITSIRALILYLSEMAEKARGNLKLLQSKMLRSKAWWNIQHQKKSCTEHWPFKASKLFDFNIYLGQMFLPSLRNCSLEFLKDILSDNKKYLLQSQVMNFHVQKCLQLTVSEVFN